jgi:hypothetical protein
MALGQQFVEQHKRARRPMRVCTRVVGDHFAAKSVGNTGDHTTDLPKADNSERSPG